VQVRLSVDNPGLLLKPGMFVDVNFKSSLGRRLVIPASSVLETGLKQIVFLDKGDGRIEPKEVVLGPRIGDNFVVLKGLEAHQPIVTSANFLIDSESQMQAGSSASAPSVPNSDAGAGGASRQSLQIAFTTNPDPPRKGSNALSVKLTGGTGAKVSGADVSVAFHMAAMPEMGMAAMNMTEKLAEKSAGFYQGTRDLPSGGTWQVVVTAKQHGQIVATKKLTVNAKGGM
jgi:Cu(I)/Ag(I) efflux system membrane fusion protein/cobalt-zinc-cadmium efflux system membrane fusion protein